MKHEIDMLDDEYTTPQQAAEIRRIKAELPLWQEMEAMTTATVNVAPNAIDCFSTEAPSQVQTDVDLHRALNGTVGMESEE